jgi:hypothetical protein
MRTHTSTRYILECFIISLIIQLLMLRCLVIRFIFNRFAAPFLDSYKARRIHGVYSCLCTLSTVIVPLNMSTSASLVYPPKGVGSRISYTILS